MSDNATHPGSDSSRYEIRLKGRLSPRWAATFDGMTLTAHEDGTTVLRGPVADQAALHGLLRRLGGLGVPLLSVTQIDPDNPSDPGPST
jgi:hypothetical protein